MLKKVRLHTTSTFQSKNESVPGMYGVWYPTRSFRFSLSVTLMIAKIHNETNLFRLREDGGREIKEEVRVRDTMIPVCTTVIPLPTSSLVHTS